MRDPGSPPHTRGQVFHQIVVKFFRGITPAYAGTSSVVTAIFRKKEDHPRIRGDKENVAAIRIDAHGSPPHTRGQVQVEAVSAAYFRITPAYAGTSSSPGIYRAPSRDHPRIRGDKTATNTQIKHIQGSPPHTRGQVSKLFRRRSKWRITPAYAGTSNYSKTPEPH